MNASDLLSGIRLMPVVVIDRAHDAVPLARALSSAGIKAIEITLRTPAALGAIAHISAQVPDVLVGAGSIRQPDQFSQVREAGAAFAVSPGATPTLLDAATLPYIPGAATASECLTLLEAGYALQKFFPAESSGGVSTLKALNSPLPEVSFCPTGGITAELAPEYFALDCVACVGGSWFVPRTLINERDFDAIAALAKQANELAQG